MADISLTSWNYGSKSSAGGNGMNFAFCTASMDDFFCNIRIGIYASVCQGSAVENPGVRFVYSYNLEDEDGQEYGIKS